MAPVAAAVALLALAGCWEDRQSCELWAAKLARGEEPTTAVQQLAAGHCTGARGALLDHLGDDHLGADVLAALVALGQSPEAETAVRRSLARADTAVAAAQQVATWRLTSAEPELRAALADAALASHRGALVTAALELAPAERWVDALSGVLEGDDGALAARALALLSTVDWARVEAPSRARALAGLADLASRPGVTRARAAAALHELARVPVAPIEDVTVLVRRAAAGSREALLVLWCLGRPEAEASARASIERRAGSGEARALALAIAPSAAMPRLAAGTVDAEDAVDLVLAAGAEAVPWLRARIESDKGAGRAAAARALCLALPARDLAGWSRELAESPSQLLRSIPEEPVIVRVRALAARCGENRTCYADSVTQGLSRLATLDAEIAAAREALFAAEQKAQAAVAEDSARAQELAAQTGLSPEALAAARAELEAISARRDALYAPVREASSAVAALSAEPVALAYALRHVDSGETPPVARAILASCRGQACAALRAWAAAAIEERALACLSETGDEATKGATP